MTELLGILEDRLEIGDAVLSGGVDPLSLLIQIGTRSRFSHMAVVTGPGQLTEAYDYGLNLDESDDGIYGLSFSGYAARATTMRQLQILRPQGIDRDRVTDTAAYLRDHSPGFPTMGMMFLAFCGLSTPVLRRLPDARGRRSTLKQVLMAGDGVRRMHCAETATRLYHEAGLPIRFESPRLKHHIHYLTHYLDEHGDRTVPASHSPGNDLVDLPTTHRTADRGVWPEGGFKAFGNASALKNATNLAVSGFRNTWRERTGSQDQVDVADLILPGDFMRASPFDRVARFNWDGDTWVEAIPTTIQLEGRTTERRLAIAASDIAA